jgi:hypothetical protein
VSGAGEEVAAEPEGVVVVVGEFGAVRVVVRADELADWCGGGDGVRIQVVRP